MRGSDPTENQSVGKFLLTLCQGKGTGFTGYPAWSKAGAVVYRLVFHIGYANAAGFLFNNNLLGQVHEQLLSEPVDYSSGGIHSSDEDEAHSNRLTGFNPITGKDESDSRPLEEMTEEEKEAETERVLQALEQLEKTGIVKMFKQ